MAYSGSTAASSLQNPPILLTRFAGAGKLLGGLSSTAWSSVGAAPGIGLWQYNSTNLTTDICAAGFFSDGKQLGMQIGDIMINTQYTSLGSSFIVAMGVVSTTNSTAGYNLTTLGTITSTRASSL